MIRNHPTPAEAGCKIHQFLKPGQVDEVFRLIERSNAGIPANLLKGWKPSENAFLECPYYQITGEHSEQCKEGCYLYELVFKQELSA